MTGRATTTDRLLGGRIVIVQPETGFRAGTDSVLLGAACGALSGIGTAFEAGCGAGAALFVAAHHLPEAHLTGLDLDGGMAALARQGAELNAFGARVGIIEGDLGGLPQDWENRFDLAFSNPPYFEPGRASAPGEGKAGAYGESLPLDAWLKAMLHVLKPKGTIVLIHRAADLARLLSRLDRQAGEITVLPIRPAPGTEASRVLVRARKGLRSGPVRLLAGLDLHETPGGSLTARARDALEGRGLDWR